MGRTSYGKEEPGTEDDSGSSSAAATVEILAKCADNGCKEDGRIRREEFEEGEEAGRIVWLAIGNGNRMRCWE